MGMVGQTEQEPSRKARKAYEEALEAYRFGAHAMTESYLSKAIGKCPNYADAWFLKAQLYRDLDKPEVADVLAHALSIDGTKFPFGWVELAQIQWESGQYSEGLETLQSMQSMGLQLNEESAQKMEWVEAGLLFSNEMQHTPSSWAEAHVVEGALNTNAEEYYGALDLSGRHMVLTRHGITDEAELRLPGVAGGEDFFESLMLDDGTWTAPVPLVGVNTPMNEGAPTLSGDGKIMVFAACETLREGYGPRRGKGSCDLFESVWDESLNRWSMGKNLGAPNSSGWESQPTLSADGNTLIFAKSTKGKRAPSDLVICHRLANGGWSTPRPLNGLVNTSYVEESPFLHPDGVTLYFSSDGHPGFGKLDVFVSRLQPDGTWGSPSNLGPAINGCGTDNSLMVMPQGDKAFFASTKDGGDLDFWEVPLPSFGTPTVIHPLRGIVVDAQTGEPIEASVELVDVQTGRLLGRLQSNRSSGFVLPMPEEGRYSFGAFAKDHLFGMVFYDQAEEGASSRLNEVRIELEPIHAGQTFVLEAIQFETGRAALLEEYQAGCERMALWMNENPEVSVLIEGHTDDVGSEASNLELSMSRAQNVRNFLTDRGVEPARIQIDGRGASEPISTNDSEEGRALNRRVQVVILGNE